MPRTRRANPCRAWQLGREITWGLGMPLIILGGIYGGVFTATEAAAVSVIYAAFVCVLVYRKLDLKELMGGLHRFRAGQRAHPDHGGGGDPVLLDADHHRHYAAMVEPFADLRSSPEQTLLFVNVLALIAGMFIDVFSNILILVPILMPMVTAAGISGTHFGIVMTVNTDIGNITPPFGLNLFVASGTFDKSYMTVVAAVLPWLALALFSLAVITYVPAISLWLPRQLYPEIR